MNQDRAQPGKSVANLSGKMTTTSIEAIRATTRIAMTDKTVFIGALCES